MVHEDRVRAALHGFLDQGAAGRDAGHELAHRVPPFHLQPVGPVVAEPLGREQGVEGLQQVLPVGHAE